MTASIPTSTIAALVKKVHFSDQKGLTTVIKAISDAIDAKKGAAVTALGQTISASPTQAEVQAISTKVDALIASLKAAGLLS